LRYSKDNSKEECWHGPADDVKGYDRELTDLNVPADLTMEIDSPTYHYV
jgi:hypothetical protein